MIRTIGDKRVQEILDGRTPRRFPPDLVRQTERRLKFLAQATRLEDLLNPPSNRLEMLRGDREGTYSIRINRQWRLCFRWQDKFADDVEITDYH